ncbi:unnamed protein product [Heligmosomoides polygyrus]|uniref:Uncharacterized protein n=1 Tax=Heligmosomoides polygyrus TaxID=6339 RepID=A0A183GHE9_HELPZ|nr:unnamed protein product [Heligmosomoides polygyrus]
MLVVTRLTQAREGLRNSKFHRRSKIRDASREPSQAGFRGCQENTRTPTDALVGLLRESPERPIWRSSCPSSEEDPFSGMRPRRMETLLAPARASR